jgi:hypothetical protein
MSKEALKLALEAGIRDCTCNGTLGCLERFAELARADEREACAKVCDAVAQQMDDEGEGPTGNIGWVNGCADAIRARSNT